MLEKRISWNGNSWSGWCHLMIDSMPIKKRHIATSEWWYTSEMLDPCFMYASSAPNQMNCDVVVVVVVVVIVVRMVFGIFAECAKRDRKWLFHCLEFAYVMRQPNREWMEVLTNPHNKNGIQWADTAAFMASVYYLWAFS